MRCRHARATVARVSGAHGSGGAAVHGADDRQTGVAARCRQVYGIAEVGVGGDRAAYGERANGGGAEAVGGRVERRVLRLIPHGGHDHHAECGDLVHGGLQPAATGLLATERKVDHVRRVLVDRHTRNF